MSFNLETIFKYPSKDLDAYLASQNLNPNAYPDIRQKRYMTIYQLATKNAMINDKYLANPNLQKNVLTANSWEEFKNLNDTPIQPITLPVQPTPLQSVQTVQPTPLQPVQVPIVTQSVQPVTSKLVNAPSSSSLIIVGPGSSWIMIDDEKYISTAKTFRNYSDKYKYYKWVTPQKDTDKAGYFIFIYNDGTEPSKNIDITANKTMLGDIQLTTEEDYNETDNEEGTTTFIIDPEKIPIGSSFKWNNKGYWVYKNTITNMYYKIALKLDSFIYTFNSLVENKAYDDKLTEFRLIEKANDDALHAAMSFKQTLVEHSLNVVTAESLTAGMLAKILVDIPSNGAAVYGGFIVYDTDAKREFLGVKTEGVYTHATAEQMAYGALENSRAMVSLAVTGNAMPYPEDADHMGDVYIAVGLRYPNETSKFTVVSEHFNFCEKIPKLCSDWKYLHSRKDAEGKYKVFAPIQLTSFIADFVRLSTVKEACLMGVKYINQLDADRSLVNLKTVEYRPWDKICSPSNILKKHINDKKNQISNSWCNDYKQDNINI